MWQNAMWIGLPAGELEKWNITEGDLTGRSAFFRLEQDIPAPAGLTIDITANSRYRLWVNGMPVLSGPCKGDLYRTYYDTVDLSGYLLPGKNVFAVSVLYNNAFSAVDQYDDRAAIFGLLTPAGGHRLAIEAHADGAVFADITTGRAPWRVYLEGSSFLMNRGSAAANLGSICECLDLSRIPTDWKEADFDAAGWNEARALEPVLRGGFSAAVGLLPRFDLKERPIPLLYEKEAAFLSEICNGSFPSSGILSAGEITVPAHTSTGLILDAEEIVNGYPRYTFDGGRKATVEITYFEKFTCADREIPRDDASGAFEGITDTLVLNGRHVVYEPFWHRTFRFVCIQVTTADEPVRMAAPAYRRTGYPLKCVSRVSSSETWAGEVWQMCVRTLSNCMMDTYMDCPFYEQMQFPMDTRLQALFTYAVSADTRLAKKALEDYHCCIMPDGLIHGKYPSAYPQIISTFSLHYIYMLAEYFEQTADVSGLRRYLPDIDRILYYYDSHITSDGMVGRLGYWEFVDWHPLWAEYQGAPAALQHGPSTIINLMYAWALECGAMLNEVCKRSGMAAEYRARRSCILKAVQALCWDEERALYREGPYFYQYSCHAQAWAVLNGMAENEAAALLLRRAAGDDDVLKVSFSTAYEWFRACGKAGVYELTGPYMDMWKALPGMGCTCCPETPANSRSDCHGWSALPMYELIRTYAGVRAGAPGWESAIIRPALCGMKDLRGTAATPKGAIDFSYTRLDAHTSGAVSYNYEILMPAGLSGRLIKPDGTEEVLPAGTLSRGLL